MKFRWKTCIWIFIYLTVLLAFIIVGVGGSQIITVMASHAPIENRVCLVIDAGHGGEDGGTTSCTGVLEKKINLEISVRLRDLCHLLGIQTKMIRTEDTALCTEGETIAQRKLSDLKNRVEIVNNTTNAILLSIHQNYYADSEYWGAQMFYNKTEAGRNLAQMLQREFQNCFPGNHRKSKEATGVYLMKHTLVPSVLIECGFLSNPEEESKLRDPQYQKSICCVIVCTCSKYLYGSDGDLTRIN